MRVKEPVISMVNINKSFGKVIASKNINLDIYAGEVHALLGENGAGKSTLISILSGVYVPDSGVISIDGKEIKLSSPKDAIKQGIGTIYQHFKLIENMKARDNLTLGKNDGIFKKNRKIDIEIKNICDRYGLEIDLDKYVSEMSVGEKQNLEILRVLYRGAKVLILDEPTAVFTPQETRKLFNIIEKMREQGTAVIFITHKMDEVMEISDKITVLRKGETIKTLSKKSTSPEELTKLMVGYDLDMKIERVTTAQGKVLLDIKNLTINNNEGINIIKNISFNIKEGEILGIAGIAGCGQKELCEAIAGIMDISKGEIIFEGEHLEGKGAREFIKRGISMSFIPEDRLGMGLVGSMDMVENLLLKQYHSQKGMFLKRKSLKEEAKALVTKLQIKTPNIHYPIKYLSGGNIQKILLGRELNSNPKLLVMAYPVRGLDINTCYTIYDLINKEKQKGTAILFVGEDLDVLIELCDRIMVMCNGEVEGTVLSENTSKDELGLMMTGARSQRGMEEVKVG